jgi:hypothetical protein
MVAKLLSVILTREGVMNKWKGLPHEDIPRCGAKTRSGGLCGHYSMPNSKCRYHGGKSTGAHEPKVKHGMYTKETLTEKKWLKELLREADKLLEKIN